MADVVSEEKPAPLARPKPEPVVSQRRFGAAYLALAAIIGAAVGLIVVFSTRSSSHPAAVKWSAWQPGSTGTRGVREIARYVSARYHLDDGTQLAATVGGPMQIPSIQGPIPVSALLVESGAAGVTQQKIDVAFPQAGIFYQLCGTGGSCAIPKGTDPKRERLVRREAVELSLYAFHYLPQADYLVAFLPPQPGVQQTDPRFHRALFFQRSALATELSAPLHVSLPEGSVRMTPTRLTSAEAATTDGIVAGRLYHYDFQLSATQSALVSLAPIEP